MHDSDNGLLQNTEKNWSPWKWFNAPKVHLWASILVHILWVEVQNPKAFWMKVRILVRLELLYTKLMIWISERFYERTMLQYSIFCMNSYVTFMLSFKLAFFEWFRYSILAERMLHGTLWFFQSNLYQFLHYNTITLPKSYLMAASAII